MTFGIRSLTRTALLASAILVSACGSDDDNGGGPGPTPTSPAPTGVAAAANGQTAVNVTWTAPTTAATQFVLQRATGAQGAFAEIARPAGNAMSYADQGLTATTTYRYRLAAIRSGETSAFSAEASATTEDETPTSNVVEVTTAITTNTTWTADKAHLLTGLRN